MGIPDTYAGREQVFVKHEVMRAYLELLLMVSGQREWRICYVDCFAGPWQEGAEELEETSAALALDIMQKCHHRLGEQRKDVYFRALFLEKNQKAFQNLEGFLDENSWDGVSTSCFNGDFPELRDRIISWCGSNDLCFFFIDPTSWRDIAVSTLQPLLKRPKSEFLINVLYDSMLRATQAGNEQQMAAVFGTLPDTAGMNPEEKEEFLIRQYKSALKAEAAGPEGEMPRCVHTRVLHPTIERTLYDVVYLSSNPLGVVDFVEASEKLRQDQKRIRALARQEKKMKASGQREMFAADKLVREEKAPVRQEVKDYWLARLSRNPKLFGLIEFADMLEETGWSMDDFQRAFLELEAEGKVRNLASTGSRSTRAVHYLAANNRGELLKRM